MRVGEKYRIVEKIIQTEDETILSEIKSLLGIDEISGDYWNTRPDSIKHTQEESFQQIKNGNVLASEEVMMEIKKRFLLNH